MLLQLLFTFEATSHVWPACAQLEAEHSPAITHPQVAHTSVLSGLLAAART